MIYETIITTANAGGGIHIAPMGIHDHGDLMMLAPFQPSTTLENLKRTGEAVVNLTDDVTIFAGCVTGRRDWPTFNARTIGGGVLEAALAHVEVKVQRVEDDELRPRFFCRPCHRETHAPFAGFNRAQAAVVEAAILVTRLDRLPADKVDREIAYLAMAVEKTAGESEQQAWQWLMESIEVYRQRQSQREQQA